MTVPNILNITEQDFVALSVAANVLKERGDIDLARRLDKIARKANAGLSNAQTTRMTGFHPRKPLKWRDIPSVFDTPDDG